MLIKCSVCQRHLWVSIFQSMQPSLGNWNWNWRWYEHQSSQIIFVWHLQFSTMTRCSLVHLREVHFSVFLLALSRLTYLGPLGIELTSFFSIIQSRLVLSHFEKGCRTVTVQDAVLRVGLQGLAVQMDGRLEVAALTRLVALLHFLHEVRFAEAIPAAVVYTDTPDGSARCPRTEDWKLEERTERSERALKRATEQYFFKVTARSTFEQGNVFLLFYQNCFTTDS